MKTSAAGRKAIMQREGVRTRAYRDSRGIWTCGCGHAAGAPKVWPWTSWTPAQVDSVLANDLASFEAAVSRAVKRQLSQNEFDACVSLAFNIGAGGFAGSSVVRQINAGNTEAAANDFLMWDHPAELLGRRQSERKQFLATA